MIPWFKKNDIRVRALVMQEAKVLIITVKDHRHDSILDCSKHRIPPNYKTAERKNKWIAHKLNGFISGLREIGLDVEYMTATNAGFARKTYDMLKQKFRGGPYAPAH